MFIDTLEKRPNKICRAKSKSTSRKRDAAEELMKIIVGEGEHSRMQDPISIFIPESNNLYSLNTNAPRYGLYCNWKKRKSGQSLNGSDLY